MTPCWIHLLLISAMLSSLSACHSNKLEPSSKPQMELSALADSLTTEATCMAKGGHWKKVGKLQQSTCILPTRDAGKDCKDSSECQTACLLTDKEVAPGTLVTGQCQDSTHQFGCRTHVTHGKAEATLCID